MTTFADLATATRNELLCWSTTREAAGALTFLWSASALLAVVARRAGDRHLARCLAVVEEAAALGLLDDEALTVEVPSETKAGVAYTVALDGSRCSCPGFTFRGTCKHVAPSRRAA